MIRKIISGGQTGADQAGLDAALRLGVPHGGWIPRGRVTENGRLPDKYKLKEMATSSYPERTEKNVTESDGTVIFSHGKLTGGSKLTWDLTVKRVKPCIHIDLKQTIEVQAAILLNEWIVGEKIEVLNVAGARVSKDPAIYDKVFHIIESVLLMDLVGAEPGQKLTDYSIQDYEQNVPVLDPTSDAAVDQIINDLPLNERVAIANMNNLDINILQAILEKFIYEKDGVMPERMMMAAVWKKLKETHKIRAVK